MDKSKNELSIRGYDGKEVIISNGEMTEKGKEILTALKHAFDVEAKPLNNIKLNFKGGLSLTCECSNCGEKIQFNKEDITLMKTIYSKNEIKEVYGVRCSNCGNYTYINEE